MYIPPTNSAAQAAGVAAQAAGKDKSSENATPAATAQTVLETLVEQTGAANADRDAAGQGDGLPHSERTIQDENDVSSEADAADVTPTPTAPLLPGEDPGELDLLG